MPKVSVITPSFNHAQFLGDRISSIRGQTFEDFEWIIVDDCSTDNSREILRAAAQIDSRIRLFFNTHNLGMAETVRRAIQESSGQLLYRAESDDSCDTHLLERMVEVFEAHRGVGLVHCRALHMDENGALWGGFHQSRNDYVKSGLETFRSLVMRNHICGSNMMFTRSAHDEIGGFGTGRFQSACDYHFSLLVCLKYDVAYIAEPLGFHRTHGNNLSGTVERTFDLDFLFRETFDVLLDVFNQIPGDETDLLALQRSALRNVTRCAITSAYVSALVSGKYEVAKNLADRTERYDPGGTKRIGWYTDCVKALCSRWAYRRVYMPTVSRLQRRMKSQSMERLHCQGIEQ